MSFLGRVFRILQGRSTGFFCAFFITGNVMHWFHRLDGTYVTYMGTLLGAVIGHSVKEDIFTPKTDAAAT